MKTLIQRFVFLVLLSFGSLVGYSQLNDLSPTGGGFGIGGGFGFPTLPVEPIRDGIFLYVPNTNLPHSIREKSDIQFSISQSIVTSSDWDFNIKNFNLAYSPLPHLYGTANLMILKDAGLNYFDSKMVQGDIGIGTYYLKPLGNISKKENIFNRTADWMMSQKGILASGMLGYSRGSISHQINSVIGHGKFTINKFYGQIGLDFQAKLWGIAGSAKFGILNYGTTYLEARAITTLSEPIDILRDKNNFYFREFEVRAYLGIRYGQLYWSMVNTATSDALTNYTLTNYQTVGILLDFQEIFKKKNKEL